jgi:hypothetical protein
MICLIDRIARNAFSKLVNASCKFLEILHRNLQKRNFAFVSQKRHDADLALLSKSEACAQVVAKQIFQRAGQTANEDCPTNPG